MQWTLSDYQRFFFFHMQEMLIRQFLLTNLIRSTPDSATTPSLKFRIPVKILARALDDMAGFPFHPDQVRFEKPALFIRGTKSHYVPDEVMPLIGRFFPYFQLKDIEAGHWGKFLSYTHFLHALRLYWDVGGRSWNKCLPQAPTPICLTHIPVVPLLSSIVRCFSDMSFSYALGELFMVRQSTCVATATMPRSHGER